MEVGWLECEAVRWGFSDSVSGSFDGEFVRSGDERVFAEGYGYKFLRWSLVHIVPYMNLE